MQIKTTLNCRGTLIDLSTPKVMGILNLTPDSFFDGGKFTEQDSILRKVELMVNEGATFIDIGAASSRPGSQIISEREEMNRLLNPLKAVLNTFPSIIISIDTWRASVAEETLKMGAAIINDITAGLGDKKMLPVVSKYKVPFIAMHMQGTPQTMQQNPLYADVTKDVLKFFIERISIMREHSIHDIIIDPGFGFGKTLQHNYELLKNLSVFNIAGLPVLAGLSRKGMIYKTLNVTAKEALNGTTALNMFALQNGAKILRVHDVKEAMECIKLSGMIQ